MSNETPAKGSRWLGRLAGSSEEGRSRGVPKSDERPDHAIAKGSVERVAGQAAAAIKRFVEAGNRFEGEPRVIGTLTINTGGTGGAVEIGDNVVLRDVRINIGGGRIIIESDAVVCGWLRADRGSTLRIGARTAFNRPSAVVAAEGADVTIGEDCLFSDATVNTSDLHSIVDRETGARLNPPRSVVIEARVWLAARATVMPGVRIGCGSIIGAGAVVTKPVPTYSSAAGMPARVLRRGVSWKRDRLPLPPEPAATLERDAYGVDRLSFMQLTVDRRFGDIVALVAEHEAAGGKPLEAMPIALRWYGVQAMVRLGHDPERARGLLERIVEEKPGHQRARTMLEALLAPPGEPETGDGV